MCSPQLLAIGLQTAGGYMRGKAQSNYVNETNNQNDIAYNLSRDARLAERQRQQGFETQANTTFADTLANMGRGGYDATASGGAADFTSTLAALNKPALVNSGFSTPAQSGASADVKDWAARAANKAAAITSDRIAALANMTGSASAFGDRGLNLRSGGDAMSMINGLRRGSLGVSRFEQNIPAANVHKGSTVMADILSGAGTLAGSGALGGTMGQGSVFDLMQPWGPY